VEKVKLYDTTLRDGMQAEGVSFSLEDKLSIAKCLDELGLDYIEGGYAASNPKEMQFFEEVAKLDLKNSKIVAFGSTRRAHCSVADDLSLNSILACKTTAATLVGKSWDMHVTNVLGCSPDENLAICAESVEHLKNHGIETIFDAEHFYDGYKSNAEYAMEVLAAAAEAGADVLVLCDTNGGSLPDEVYATTKAVCEAFATMVVGIHTHNDTDCATASCLAAVRAGARHVQGTMNGLGERCGNANLCTVIPNLAFKMGFEALSGQKIKTLTEVSRFIFEIGNLTPVMNMPYVGESAFAHKAGLHVDALRKDKRTYEHIAPELLLVKKIMGAYRPSFDLIKYHVNVEKRATGDLVTEATVKLKVGDKEEHVVGEGDGPVNALDAALRKSLENFYPGIKDIHLIDYKVRVVNAGAGTAARVRVIIESRDKNSIWGTVGVSENIIEASWLALVDSVEYKLQKDAQ